MFINSSDRKLYLSGWLQNNCKAEYENPLKLQKFLVLYELSSKTENDSYELTNLKGYKNGPLFSKVYGDYTYRRSEFDKASDDTYRQDKVHLDEERIKKCAFLTHILTEKELSDFTHKMNIWACKKNQILKENKSQVDLFESDFTSDDANLLKQLLNVASVQNRNSHVLKIGQKSYLLSNEDYKKLSPEHLDALYDISDDDTIYNPVYVEIDEEGCLVID